MNQSRIQRPELNLVPIKRMKEVIIWFEITFKTDDIDIILPLVEKYFEAQGYNEDEVHNTMMALNY